MKKLKREEKKTFSSLMATELLLLFPFLSIPAFHLSSREAGHTIEDTCGDERQHEFKQPPLWLLFLHVLMCCDFLWPYMPMKHLIHISNHFLPEIKLKLIQNNTNGPVSHGSLTPLTGNGGKPGTVFMAVMLTSSSGTDPGVNNQMVAEVQGAGLHRLTGTKQKLL